MYLRALLKINKRSFYGIRFYLFLAVMLGIITGCTANKDEILSLFFDGVLVESQKDGSGGSGEQKLLVVHPPYKERDCEACHDLSAPGKKKLSDEIPELCFECHDDDNFTKEEIHSPVEDGECMECHNPHKTAEDKLLRKPVIATCFGCHDKEDIYETEELEAHLPLKEEPKACNICHNPHSSDHEFLIREETANKKEI